MSAPVMSPNEPLPPPPSPAGVTYVAQVRPAKQPLLALALSFFLPGMGQVYNGQTAKALTFFAGFVTAIYLTSEVNGMPFAFFIPFTVFYAMIDAYRSATLINNRAAGTAAPEEDNSESPVWGGVLVGIGLLLLLGNLGWLNLAAVQRFWPLVLVIAGLAFLRNAMQKKGSGNGGSF